jgi:phosphoglucosamine mutase
LDRLSAAVTSGGYDLGFAFDGDADRCLAVDETGRVIDGDMLIACLARDRIELCGGPETAVVTVLTNLAFHHYCKKYGIAVSITDVGDRYVLREMLRIGADIGGEQSGHIILPRYATTGDGQVTAAVAIGLLARSAGKKASEVFGQMVPLPQASRNVRVPREDKERVLSHPALSEISETVRHRLGNEGRVLIRPSGTEALIRIMLEGKNQEEIDRMAEEIAETIQKICGVQ